MYKTTRISCRMRISRHIYPKDVKTSIEQVTVNIRYVYNILCWKHIAAGKVSRPTRRQKHTQDRKQLGIQLQKLHRLISGIILENKLLIYRSVITPIRTYGSYTAISNHTQSTNSVTLTNEVLKCHKNSIWYVPNTW